MTKFWLLIGQLFSIIIHFFMSQQILHLNNVFSETKFKNIFISAQVLVNNTSSDNLNILHINSDVIMNLPALHYFGFRTLDNKYY